MLGKKKNTCLEHSMIERVNEKQVSITIVPHPALHHRLWQNYFSFTQQHKTSSQNPWLQNHKYTALPVFEIPKWKRKSNSCVNKTLALWAFARAAEENVLAQAIRWAFPARKLHQQQKLDFGDHLLSGVGQNKESLMTAMQRLFLFFFSLSHF